MQRCACVFVRATVSSIPSSSHSLWDCSPSKCQTACQAIRAQNVIPRLSATRKTGYFSVPHTQCSTFSSAMTRRKKSQSQGEGRNVTFAFLNVAFPKLPAKRSIMKLSLFDTKACIWLHCLFTQAGYKYIHPNTPPVMDQSFVSWGLLEGWSFIVHLNIECAHIPNIRQKL